MNAHSFGVLSACLAENVHPDVIPELEGLVGGLQKSAAYGRQLAGLAHDIYVEAGEENSLEKNLYLELSKTANWEPQHFEFVEPVLEALAVKSAALAAALEVAKNVPQYAIGASAIGGGALGTLHWALNRDAVEDDAKSKSIAARTTYYKQLAKEISQGLREHSQPGVRRALRKELEQAESKVTPPVL